MNLEETLNGGYHGLHGEVVEADCYRLRQLSFVPDIIFDIGANVGIFTRYARQLFPQTPIISVEPNPENCKVFRQFTNPDNITLLEMALGKGQIFHGLTAANGSGETYLSAGLGYPEEKMLAAAEGNQGMEMSFVPTITLSQLVKVYWRKGMKGLMKIDCEGAENSIWEDEREMKALAKMDYIAMEIHDYALTQEERVKVVQATHQALTSLEKTHLCSREGVHFWATRKV